MSKKKKSTTFTEVKGDVLELFFDSSENAILMHGANCQKVMGAGIADQIRKQISPLFYLDQFDPRTPTHRFGSYSALVIGTADEKIKIGVNLYTQFNPGANFDLTAFRNSLKAFTRSIPEEKRSEMTIYMPKIGCGIGGSTWDKVSPVVEKELASFNIIVVEYKKSKPALEEPPLTKGMPEKTSKEN
jgi:O-acetyl-ADP-ribose deacetylase (regulator of RNase III)